jgi:flagellar capping protein FliD
MDWYRILEERFTHRQIMIYMKVAYNASYPSVADFIKHYNALTTNQQRALLRETSKWYKTYGISK